MNSCFAHFASLVLVVLAGVLTSGCATSSISTDAAEPVPAERILSTEHSMNRPGTCLVMVKRDTGSAGSECTSRLLVDGKPVADLATGEKVSLYLPFGEHIIGADPNGKCHGGLSTTSLTVLRDRSTTLRIRYGANGEFTIQPTAM